jgi:hypothetical protein
MTVGGGAQFRIRALDDTNRTVYVSDVFSDQQFKQINISKADASIKWLQIEGLPTNFYGYMVLDNLTIGSTKVLAFNAGNGQMVWTQDMVPMDHVRVHSYDSTGSSYLYLGYHLHEKWQNTMLPHRGALAIDTSTGTIDWTLNPYINANVDYGPMGIYNYTKLFTQEVVGIADQRYGILHGDSKISLYGTITDNYYLEIPYASQNTALWQINTNKKFKKIYSGNFDTDIASEFVLFNGEKFIAVLDNNGALLWKYVSPIDISDVVIGYFDSTSIQQAGVITKDGRIILLDSSTGLPTDGTGFGQFLRKYDILSSLVDDVDDDGDSDLFLGMKDPAYANKGYIYLFKYNSGVFYRDEYEITTGAVTELKPAQFGTKGLWALVKGKSVLAYDYPLTLRKTIINTPLTMTVGDFNADGYTDVVYVNSNGYIGAYMNDSETFSQQFFDSFNALRVTIQGIQFTNSTMNYIFAMLPNSGAIVIDITNNTYPIVTSWEDRALYSQILAKSDIDRDGDDDSLLYNDNLIYALDLIENEIGSLQIFPIWSAPLSESRIIDAIVIDVNLDGYEDVVFLNNDGQLFFVEGITMPITTVNPKFYITSVTKIDSLQWFVHSLNYDDPIINIATEITTIIEKQTGFYDLIDIPVIAFTSILGLITTIAFRKRLKRTKMLPYKRDENTQGGSHQ